MVGSVCSSVLQSHAEAALDPVKEIVLLAPTKLTIFVDTNPRGHELELCGINKSIAKVWK